MAGVLRTVDIRANGGAGEGKGNGRGGQEKEIRPDGNDEHDDGKKRVVVAARGRINREVGSV